MNVKQHVIWSLPFGAIYYYFSKDILSTSIAAASAIVVDVDHFLDYFITQKRLASIRDMVAAFKTYKVIQKNYFLLHSWELVFLLAVFIFIYPNPYVFAVFAGYTFHMLLDQVYNGCFLGAYNIKGLFYFFFYRMHLNFDVPALRRGAGTANHGKMEP